MPKVDKMLSSLEREKIYQNVSLLCPKILFYSVKHISERRAVARIKPGDILRDKDLLEAINVFSVTKSYDYNTGRLIDFAQSIANAHVLSVMRKGCVYYDNYHVR